MSDKYNRPISARLLIVSIFAIGLIYGVSHIPLHPSPHHHGVHDAHGEGHEGAHGDAEHHDDAHPSKDKAGH